MRRSGVFQRSGKLVRIALIKAKNSDGGEFLVPGIVAVTPPILERALGNAATWQRYEPTRWPQLAGTAANTSPRSCRLLAPT